VKAFAISDTLLYVATAEGGVFRATNQNGTAWTRMNYTGMTSGKINCIAGLGINIIAGSADSGIFVSSNKGDVWVKRNAGLTNLSVGALAVSGTDIYAGTKAGVFMSADTGKTWTLKSTGITNLDIISLASSGTIVFAGINGGGVFGSINGGTTWSAANTGLAATDTINALAISGTNIYAGTNHGVYLATTALPAWSAINTGFVGNVKIWSFFASGGNLYSGSNRGVYVTPESAISWVKSNTGLADTAVAAVIVKGTKLFAGTKNTRIYSSPVSAISFAAVKTGFANLKVSAMASSNAIVVGGTNHGLFVSLNDAVLYTARNTGLTDSLNVTAIEIVNGKLFAGTMNAGMFMSLDTGKTWLQVNTGLTQMHIKDITSNATALLIGTADSGVFSSPISAINWVALNSGLSIANKKIVKVYQGATYMAALTITGGVFVNKGSAWVQSNSGLTNLNVTDITSLYNRLYVSTDGGGVFRSDTGTIAWTAKNSGLPSLNIYSIGSTGAHVVTGFHGGIFATYDSASTWEEAGNPLYYPLYADARHLAFSTLRQFVSSPNNSIYSVSKGELPLPSVPVAGMTTTSYRVCVNNSVNFMDASTNVPITWNWAFGDGGTSAAKDPAHTYTTAGTFSITLIAANVGGADTVTQLITVDLCTGINEHTGVNSLNIYPNPSNGTFQVQHTGIGVKNVEVYNMFGEIVFRTTLNSWMSTLQMDMPKGVYLLRASDERTTSTSKLIIE